MCIIVYSIATSRVRRVIAPNQPGATCDEVAALAQLGNGEAMLVYQPGGPTTLNEWQAAVTEATGVTPSGDRYVAIDPATGVAVGVFVGDPACGDGSNTYAGMLLVADDRAQVGATYTPGTGFQKAARS